MGSRRASSAPGFRTGPGGTAVTMSRAGAARTAAILLLSYCPLDDQMFEPSSRIAETKILANIAGIWLINMLLVSALFYEPISTAVLLQ